ncbi:DUF480 domain-containing protein [Nocardioides sp. CFH 31398]|uniref:DUF480 domain-containing protein n=1 Tax=Nocardioides sp. CFH 31398 TaxID=2919579 RepID=UPI001F053EBD|nr:DUF480 domain-containing protein [Nocardioides sp. CFH 31398]MCH1868989.1 DUF480 domain-containing protein [Nocardioides sp. CFH 31398]
MPGTSELPVLDAPEQRVLGALLEKEVTVPGSYPMTLAGLRTACNQASSREPVTDYDESEVTATLAHLKTRDLVGVTWADSGRRTLKYVQRLSVVLDLADDARALLTVLLLRGPQPPGALRTRTERLHPFADRDAVEATLVAMAAADPALVERLPKGPREQDHRWRHLLGDPALEESVPAAPAVDRESVLAGGGDGRDETVRATYAGIAEAYAERFAEELDDLPFERWLLNRAAWLAGERPAVEVGCGPGQVTAFLADCGVEATGIDLTPAMVEQARARFPEGTYEVGDLRRLMRPTSHDGWGAVLAWYSLIHLAPSELGDAVSSLVRPLAPGGWLVLALHAGSGLKAPGSWFDVPTDLNLVLHEPTEVLAAVERAGLTDVEWYVRGPLTGREETTNRLYVLARRPD